MAALKTYYMKRLAQMIAPSFDVLQINHLLKPIYAGKGHILMLHRVLPADSRARIHNHLSLEITPRHLEEILKYLKKEGYDFISIDDVPDRIKRKTKRRFIVVTFDDGYKDNLLHALPVFEKYQVPFTVYVCNDFPDKKVFLWWYILEELLLKKEKLVIPTNKQVYQFDTSSYLKKESAFNKIRKLKNQGLISDQELNKVFMKGGIDVVSYLEDKVLSWEEIGLLASHPLVTIGAHTLSHLPLKVLDERSLKQEIQSSKQNLEKAIGKDVNHFAYPFGSPAELGKREIELVEQLHFKTAVTTSLGNIHPVHEQQLFCLPRITINSLTTQKVLKAQLSGVLPMIQNKFKRSTIEQFK